MVKTLIAGCGDVGTRLGLKLVSDGHEVWGIRRDISKLPSTIHGIAADLGDVDHPASLPPRLDYVVYCAAAGARNEENYRRTYINGLRNLLTRMDNKNQNPHRIIFTSSTAVYHQSHGEWVDETSETDPTGFAGQIMLEAEALITNSGYNTCIARFAGIYGPGRNHLIEQVRTRKLTVNDAAPQYTNRIHSDDCAGLIQHLMNLPDPEPLYIGVDSEPAPRSEVADWLATELGAEKPERNNDVSSPRGQNKRCRNTRLLESGYGFLYPTYREGYRNILSNRP